MTIYCDSVILIYLLDHTGAFHARADARMTALEATGDLIAVSDLTRMECRMKPIRFSEAKSLQQFDDFFARSDVQLVPLSTTVFDRATQLRAAHNFKVVDALHLAAAIESGCGSFLTNDARLSKCADIPIEVLP